MKKLILILLIAVSPLAFNGCASSPSTQVATVHTLQAVGVSAKTAMDASTQLLKQGTITVDQWQKVAAIYDTRFQPAFAAAVVVAHSDVSSAASPDLIAIAAELTNLVATYTK
jgi:hypothetical protein